MLWMVDWYEVLFYVILGVMGLLLLWLFLYVIRESGK